jgi:hypothetical protein
MINGVAHETMEQFPNLDLLKKTHKQNRTYSLYSPRGGFQLTNKNHLQHIKANRREENPFDFT